MYVVKGNGINKRLTSLSAGLILMAGGLTLAGGMRDHSVLTRVGLALGFDGWVPAMHFTVAGLLAGLSWRCLLLGRKWAKESSRLREVIRNLPSSDCRVNPEQFSVSEIRECADTLVTTLATLQDRHKEMHDVASRDPLTGLPNRRSLMQTLTREAAVAARTGWPLSLMMVDLDHFKILNDTYGHQAGDFVLQRASRRMASQLRRTDEVARYGGEEFVVILPNTRIEQAREVAEQLCAALRCDTLTFEGQTIGVTASIGVSEVQDCQVEHASELVRLADEALYQAKSEGRDRVVVAKPNKSPDKSPASNALQAEQQQPKKPDAIHHDAIHRDAMALMGSTFSILQLLPDRDRVAQDITEQVVAVLDGTRAGLYVRDTNNHDLACLAEVRLNDGDVVLPTACLTQWMEDLAQGLDSTRASVIDVVMEPIGPGGMSRPVVRIPLQAAGTFVGVVEAVPGGGEPTLSPRQQSVLVALCAIGGTALRNCDRHIALQDRWVHLIEALCTTIHSIHPYMREHAERVSRLAVKIARRMGQSNEDELQRIQLAGLLHDIGKIGIPRALFEKRGRLRGGERKRIQEHCELGGNILRSVPDCEYLARIVRHHHEHFDGAGYPDGLAGDEIPLESRIIALAEACDAMRSKRPYREPLHENEIRKRLLQASGTQFDPAVVSAYLTLTDEALQESGSTRRVVKAS